MGWLHMETSDNPQLRDEQLLAAVCQGSAVALEEIYREHKDSLLTLAYHMLGEMAAAEDVLQDIFVRLVTTSQLQLRGSLRSYLLKSVLNRARDLQRRADVRRSVRDTEVDHTHASDASPAERVLELERAAVVAKALRMIPWQQREVVVLHLFGGLKFREIAELLSIPGNTAQSRYRYALANLRTKMASEEVE